MHKNRLRTYFQHLALIVSILMMSIMTSAYIITIYYMLVMHSNEIISVPFVMTTSIFASSMIIAQLNAI